MSAGPSETPSPFEARQAPQAPAAPVTFLDNEKVAAFWNATRKAAEEEQQTGYLQDEWPAALGHDRLRGEWAQVERWLAQFAVPRGACLDVGCGSGVWLERLAPRFARVDGIDLSSEMVASARARLARGGFSNATIRCQGALELAEAERYDLIFVGGVLMYLDDAVVAGMLGKLARMLTPKGLLILRESTCAPHTWYRDTPLSPGLFAARPAAGMAAPRRPPYFAIYRPPALYRTLAEQQQLVVRHHEANRHYKLADMTEFMLRAIDTLTFGLLSRRRGAAERTARWIYRLRWVLLLPAYYALRTLAPRAWRLNNHWYLCSRRP